ncbi:hypothetical protein GPJ56_002036 [Histomonas meleagridis]|uniref:uncharacterized protein n=1 Tax=Histomonas meleagridis TaxID=135588 RepID=UPI003559B050|nr:hypothetical protein GPJ56_002036 [Histomonas meleagridis]KAH0797600.1 hypothetical protein GO595_009610 [Histomonas meleagridis]
MGTNVFAGVTADYVIVIVTYTGSTFGGLSTLIGTFEDCIPATPSESPTEYPSPTDSATESTENNGSKTYVMSAVLMIVMRDFCENLWYMAND